MVLWAPSGVSASTLRRTAKVWFGRDAPWTSLHSYNEHFCCVISKNVDDFYHDTILAMFLIFLGQLHCQLGFVASTVFLDFVVESIVFVVPVDSPVIDPLRPVSDFLLNIRRHIVRRYDEVPYCDSGFHPSVF